MLAHSERGEKQVAYQVLVAAQPDALAQDRGEQWDSGKVQSEDSTQMVYGGKALESGRVIWEKGQYVSGDVGIAKVMEEHNDIAIDVGSGDYSFRLTGQ